jgi:hypothetical protein
MCIELGKIHAPASLHFDKAFLLWMALDEFEEMEMQWLIGTESKVESVFDAN